MSISGKRGALRPFLPAEVEPKVFSSLSKLRLFLRCVFSIEASLECHRTTSMDIDITDNTKKTVIWPIMP